MNLVQLRAELEADQAWRRDEIRFFQNQAAKLDTTERPNPFQRVLILLLYAHFEGFSRFALILYMNAVNSTSMTCGEGKLCNCCSITRKSLSGFARSATQK